ncbi:MurR/RpiR family transcriptional regulator [Rhodococcus jostii]|uniref:MurR/RpiR family transcriptional regulator n=1 Tax=Rhodococcus jostii TaxID=132919 RepID=UPI0019670E0D|nr:MurR/RpiR family transcriptional regulator [Rhodococcus jostii]
MTELRARVRGQWDTMSRAERAVSDFLANCSAERLLYASAADLGAESRTSNATVVRTVQKLGYTGLSELKQQVAAPFSSTVAPEVRLQQRIAHLGSGYEDVSRSVWAEARERIELAENLLSADAVSQAIELILHARQAHTYGVGSSGIAAAHLALRLNRVGCPARHIDSDGFALADELLHIRHSDVVVVFAPGRVITEVDVILSRARDVGANVILVSDELTESLSDRVAVALMAPHTPTGLSAEALTSILVGDVLVQSIAAIHPDLAVETSHSLTSLRTKLGY